MRVGLALPEGGPWTDSNDLSSALPFPRVVGVFDDIYFLYDSLQALITKEETHGAAALTMMTLLSEVLDALCSTKATGLPGGEKTAAAAGGAESLPHLYHSEPQKGNPEDHTTTHRTIALKGNKGYK
eukprot:4581883-Amphidinium_carterae.1